MNPIIYCLQPTARLQLPISLRALPGTSILCTATQRLYTQFRANQHFHHSKRTWVQHYPFKWSLVKHILWLICKSSMIWNFIELSNAISNAVDNVIHSCFSWVLYFNKIQFYFYLEQNNGPSQVCLHRVNRNVWVSPSEVLRITSAATNGKQGSATT